MQRLEEGREEMEGEVKLAKEVGVAKEEEKKEWVNEEGGHPPSLSLSMRIKKSSEKRLV